MSATTFEARWYRCRVTSTWADEAKPEPDWSRVPEAKRDVVRAKWEASRMQTEDGEWLLWGPQIAWYNRRPNYRVTVLDVSDSV